MKKTGRSDEARRKGAARGAQRWWGGMISDSASRSHDVDGHKVVRGEELGANSTSPAAGNSWSAAVRLATEFLSIVLVVHVTRPPRPPSTWRVFSSLQETKVKMFGDVNGAGGSGKLLRSCGRRRAG